VTATDARTTPLAALRVPRVESRWTVAIGSTSAEAAAIVRERRRTGFVQVATLADAVGLIEEGLDGVAFLVVDADHAPTAELSALARAASASSHGVAVGLLRARGLELLRQAAERLTEEPAVAPARGTQRVFLGADQPLSLRGARIAEPPSAGGDSDRTVAELQAPSELCYLVGHGNAMHICLDGVVLCRRSAVAVEADELGVYPCFHGEACHFGRNRGDREMSVDDMRTRRIVSLACFGAIASNVPFTGKYSVGEGLLQHPETLATITTFRAATVTSADLALLYYLVNCGLAFGVTVNRANVFRTGRGEHAELLCFGDPETRMAEALDEVRCWREGSLLMLDPGESNGASRDLVGILPRGALPAHPILVDQSAGDVLNAVLDPAGAVYATIPKDWRAQPLRFRVMDRGELMDIGGTAHALAEDLGFLDTYLPLLEEVNGSSDALMETVKATHRLREQLRAWPLAELPLYLRVEDRQIAALWREVRRLVDNVGSRFAAYYRDLMSRDHRTYLTAWDSRVVTIGATSGVVHCAYCGQSVDEFQTQARLGQWRRTWGLCRASCAYVYDGDPELGRWIEAPAVWEAGGEHTIAIATRNPYGIPLEVRVIGVLKHFERGRNQIAIGAPMEIAARTPARVLLQLQVPEDVLTGTYHFAACLVIGTRVNFFRLQVPVRGRTPDPKPRAFPGDRVP